MGGRLWCLSDLQRDDWTQTEFAFDLIWSLIDHPITHPPTPIPNPPILFFSVMCLGGGVVAPPPDPTIDHWTWLYFCDPNICYCIFSVIFPGGPLPPRPPLDHWPVLHFCDHWQMTVKVVGWELAGSRGGSEIGGVITGKGAVETGG